MLHIKKLGINNFQLIILYMHLSLSSFISINVLELYHRTKIGSWKEIQYTRSNTKRTLEGRQKIEQNPFSDTVEKASIRLTHIHIYLFTSDNNVSMFYCLFIILIKLFCIFVNCCTVTINNILDRVCFKWFKGMIINCIILKIFKIIYKNVS